MTNYDDVCKLLNDTPHAIMGIMQDDEVERFYCASCQIAITEYNFGITTLNRFDGQRVSCRCYSCSECGFMFYIFDEIGFNAKARNDNPSDVFEAIIKYNNLPESLVK